MSLDPPTYLASLQSNIRQRPIPWDGAVRAGTLTEEQLGKIRAVDKVKKETRKQTVESDLDGYRILFAGDGAGKKSVLELAAKRQDVVQYILVLLSDLLDSMCLPSVMVITRPCLLPAECNTFHFHFHQSICHSVLNGD
jgi:V-type H+-transporting ATPase subunit H